MGDFNAHLGRDVVQYSFHKSSCSNGKLMHDVVEATGLFVTNTSSKKNIGKLFISNRNSGFLVFLKKVFLEILQNSQEITCARVSF